MSRLGEYIKQQEAIATSIVKQAVTETQQVEQSEAKNYREILEKAKQAAEAQVEQEKAAALRAKQAFEAAKAQIEQEKADALRVKQALIQQVKASMEDQKVLEIEAAKNVGRNAAAEEFLELMNAMDREISTMPKVAKFKDGQNFDNVLRITSKIALEQDKPLVEFVKQPGTEMHVLIDDYCKTKMSPSTAAAITTDSDCQALLDGGYEFIDGSVNH